MYKRYEVVKQYGENEDYYTIFDIYGNQHCDENGNPIRYNNFEDAEEECKLLNDEYK